LTIYLPDVSVYQAGINLAGAQAVAIKCTQGTNYYSPAYVAQAANADNHGVFRLGYHFMAHGSGSAQADLFYGHAGKTPAMADCEPTYGSAGEIVSAPTISDVCTFVDRLRARGGIIWWVYLPRWWWQQLGEPSLEPLIERGLLLWSSDYTDYSDSNAAAGWQDYGGMAVHVWQYSETTPFGGISEVDSNAFRGSKYAGKQDRASNAACRAEFIELSRTGHATPAPAPTILPPVRELVATAIGPTSVRLQWDSPAGPSPFAVGAYDMTIRYRSGKQINKDVPSYPRMVAKGANPENELFGSLPPATELYGLVRAEDPKGAHASEWARVNFNTTKAKVILAEVLTDEE
jgi:GH25 family lysozyme M1 (1,4-beta-N-acetylmuramidase)